MCEREALFVVTVTVTLYKRALVAHLVCLHVE